MADLTRVSISLESALLEAFDHCIAGKGYATRSEAIRDLIRDRLIREQAEKAKGEQVAVVMLVYDVSSLHVHLGERHCLEVSVLRGPAEKVRHLGDELLATKGVLHGEVTLTSGEGAFNRWR